MQAELEQLVAEQEQDDTGRVKPEFPWQVPFTDGLANCVGIDMNGEIETHWPRPPKGTLLVGTASWHGTRGGYNNHKCRCEPCTTAHKQYRRKRRQNGDS